MVSTKSTVVVTDTTKIVDRQSCTVVAFANAAQVPFFAAYLALQNAGRTPRKGFSLQRGVNKTYVGKVAGYKVTKVTRGTTTLGEPPSIRSAHSTSRRHRLAVIHGKVVDNADGSLAKSRKIEAAFTITENNRE